MGKREERKRKKVKDESEKEGKSERVGSLKVKKEKRRHREPWGRMGKE